MRTRVARTSISVALSTTGRRTIAVLVCAVALSLPRAAESATWYVGPFDGATPADDADCGAGKGAAPAAHPCASLAYWTGARRNVIACRRSPSRRTTTSSCR